MSTLQVLKLLNSNTESPYIIWDNSTRTELREFLKEQQTSKIRTGESDPNFGAEFRFSAHKDELVVGNVFVRIYNQQPSFPLEVNGAGAFSRGPQTGADELKLC